MSNFFFYKKSFKYFLILSSLIISMITTCIPFFIYNLKTINTLFLIFSINIFFISLSLTFLFQESKVKVLAKQFNLNLIILTTGFIYKYIYFSYFKLDIIYYFSIKDYILTFISTIPIIFTILSAFLISSTFCNLNTFNGVSLKYYNRTLEFQNLLKKIFPKTYRNIILNTLFLYQLIISMNIIATLMFLFSILNIVKITSVNLYSFSISSLNILFIYIFYNLFAKSKLFNISNYQIKLSFIFFIMLMLNSSFLSSFNIINSSESTLEKTMESRLYKNKKIFKIESTENYEFYISKPNNNLLIFKRNYNIINENP